MKPLIVKNVMAAVRQNITYAMKANGYLLIITCITIIALIVDISMAKTQPLVTVSIMNADWPLVLFHIIFVFFILGEYGVLLYLNQKVKTITKLTTFFHLNSLKIFVLIAQSIITAFLLLLVVEINLLLEYHSIIIPIITTISYGIAIALMILLGLRFFSWFKHERSKLLLVYAFSFIIVAMDMASTLLISDTVMFTNPPIVKPSILLRGSPFLESETIELEVYHIFLLSSISSFIILWIASVVFLRNYANKFSFVKFWSIISLPLLLFLIQFNVLPSNIFVPLLEQDPIFYSILLTLSFSLSLTIGGVFFGIAFLLTARKIKGGKEAKNDVKSYLLVTGLGFILLFSSNQAFAIIIPIYPPFGIYAISFVGIASYFILIGFYSSSISVSHDNELRRFIRKSVKDGFDLLYKIGASEMAQEIQDKVLRAVQNQEELISQETGINASLDMDEAKRYIDEVLREVKRESLGE